MVSTMPWIDSVGLSVERTCSHRLQQLRQTFEREELALQRHQDRVRRRHRIDGEQVERGRAVDQHVGVVGVRRDVVVQSLRSRRAAGRRGRGVVPSSSSRPERSMVEAAMCSRGTAVAHHGIAQRRLADQDVVGRAAAVAAIDAEPGRGVALRIEIDDQDALADRGECGPEIDRCGCLADAALLVGERQDARMARASFEAPYPLDKPRQSRSYQNAICVRGAI